MALQIVRTTRSTTTVEPALVHAAAPRPTHFVVSLAGADTVVQAGPVPASLAKHAQSKGARLWALFTAANPHSLALSPESNRQRHRELTQSLARAGLRYENAAVETASGRHEAVLVWNVAPARAAGLAQEFAQGSILYGDLTHASSLACEGLEFYI